jgi:mono/diheme cytochrome c family protein
LTCHSSEIIEQQTLSKEGWVGVIKKMADYGLHVDQGTTEKMASVLADSPRNPSSRNPSSLWPRAGHGLFGTVDLAQDTDLLISPLTASGLAASGRVVFQSHCAACHGREGEGQSAPRLKGRLIPKALFFATLKQGRRTMPAFEGRLSLQEMENMRAWLQ